MKTIIAILFLCSVAGSQVKTGHQSSKRIRRMPQRVQRLHLMESVYAVQAGPWIVCLDGHNCEPAKFTSIGGDGQYICYAEDFSGKRKQATCPEKAGAHSEATGKPATEKTEKK